MAELIEGERSADSEHVTIDGPDGAPVPAIHAWPTDGRAVAGVVVHPDIIGIRPLFDDLCRRLATHGFAVGAPEPFARARPEVRDATDVAERMNAVASLDDELQLGDLVATADMLRDRDGVGAVSVIGFCMGGMQVLKAAATGRFDRAVAFYGMIRVPEQWQGPKLQEPLATAARVCPTLAIFGAVDAWTPPADIEALRDAWRTRDDCEVVVVPEADHGFVHDPARPAHRADAAAAVWQRALAWLAR